MATVYEWTADELPITYDQIQDRIYQVESLFLSKTPVTDVPCSGDWGCPYAYLHDTKPVDELAESIQARVCTYLKLKRKIDSLTNARKTIGDTILRDIPFSDDVRTFIGGGYTVSVVNNGKRIDTQKVKELLTEAGGCCRLLHSWRGSVY